VQARLAKDRSHNVKGIEDTKSTDTAMRRKRRAANKKAASEAVSPIERVPDDGSGSGTASAQDEGDFLQPLAPGVCTFCRSNVEGEANTAGVGPVVTTLDEHYFESCPMLMQCDHCQQIVEIRNFDTHLLSECGRKEIFVKCDDCSHPVCIC
jgi:hypothetical protein